MNPASRNQKKNIMEKWVLKQFNKAYNFGKWDLATPCSSFVGPDVIINSLLAEEVMKYAPEVKRQETLQIATWWKQCDTNAKKFNLEPVLLFRENNHKAVAVIRQRHFWDFGLDDLDKYTVVKHTKFNLKPPPAPWKFKPLAYLKRGDTDLVMIRASEFFRLIDRL